MDRLYKRPMFRKGGSAGEGITSGLQRQGYKDPAGSVIQNDPTKVQQVGTSMEQFNKAFPQYNRANSDFLINFGLDLASRPSAGPGFGGLLTTAAQSAKEPFLQMQKTNMANTQGQRELALQFWKNLDEDEKILLQKQMDFYMSEEGGGMTQQEARDLIMYRKGPNPKEVERLKILSDQDAIVESIGDIKKTYGLGEPDAVKLQRFQKDVINDIDLSLEDRKYKLPYDGEQYFIDAVDIGERSSKDSRLVFSDIKAIDDYKDGYIYLDLESNKAYVKQGQFFIPYSEWAAEEISTD
jgi:hypothetical protein